MNNIFNIMKKNKVVMILVIVILVILVISIINYNKKDTIQVLKKNNKGKIMLFYADWCGWSQKFLPIWNEFIKECDKLNIPYETIECTDNEICSNGKYNIEGFPTIILEVDDNIIEYNGDRTIRSMLDFVSLNM